MHAFGKYSLCRKWRKLTSKFLNILHPLLFSVFFLIRKLSAFASITPQCALLLSPLALAPLFPPSLLLSSRFFSTRAQDGKLSIINGIRRASGTSGNYLTPAFVVAPKREAFQGSVGTNVAACFDACAFAAEKQTFTFFFGKHSPPQVLLKEIRTSEGK